MEGYPVRVQLVQRASTRSYYVNFPVALAEAMRVQKAEEWIWLLEDKNTLVFTRRAPLPARKPKAMPAA